MCVCVCVCVCLSVCVCVCVCVCLCCVCVPHELTLLINLLNLVNLLYIHIYGQITYTERERNTHTHSRTHMGGQITWVCTQPSRSSLTPQAGSNVTDDGLCHVSQPLVRVSCLVSRSR